MKTLVKLLIAVLILNASARFGIAAYRYYEFRDAVEQEARFGAAETQAKLQERILRLAEQRDIYLEPTDLSIEKDGTATTVYAAYLENIELIPNFYTREHLFELEVSVHPVRPLTLDDIK